MVTRIGLILRSWSWLALLSRSSTFELRIGSPQISVEYDYVGKRSIPTTDFHRQVQRHYGLHNWTYPIFGALLTGATPKAGGVNSFRPLF